MIDNIADDGSRLVIVISSNSCIYVVVFNRANNEHGGAADATRSKPFQYSAKELRPQIQ